MGVKGQPSRRCQIPSREQRVGLHNKSPSFNMKAQVMSTGSPWQGGGGKCKFENEFVYIQRFNQTSILRIMGGRFPIREESVYKYGKSKKLQ